MRPNPILNYDRRPARPKTARPMHGSGIVVFDLFTPKQCAALLQRIKKLPNEAPNSMNKYGRFLDTPSWQRWVDRLVAKCVGFVGVPLARRGHYAFAIEYGKQQRSLAAHFDTSDVTLNVCLAFTGTGGALVFEPEQIAFEQKIGRAFIHYGAHMHRAKPLTSGTRTNLVIWCKKR